MCRYTRARAPQISLRFPAPLPADGSLPDCVRALLRACSRYGNDFATTAPSSPLGSRKFGYEGTLLPRVPMETRRPTLRCCVNSSPIPCVLQRQQARIQTPRTLACKRTSQRSGAREALGLEGVQLCEPRKSAQRNNNRLRSTA
eukprot:6212254-Pleurochrysis_carterae.AAC.1